MNGEVLGAVGIGQPDIAGHLDVAFELASQAPALSKHTDLIGAVAFDAVALLSNAKYPGARPLAGADNGMVLGALALNPPTLGTNAKDPSAYPLAGANNGVILGTLALDSAAFGTDAEHPGARTKGHSNDAMIVSAMALNPASDNASTEYCDLTCNRRISSYLCH
ncbi:hypothetical protein [Luteitalea pratensis]|uniref:hypothetical protein n=1 Tax=Luteitalea pratensis TaxID=1855912 RepID=UPI0012FFC02F|nr:hypothetical protein [Luteitalea pratensis]